MDGVADVVGAEVSAGIGARTRRRHACAVLVYHPQPLRRLWTIQKNLASTVLILK